MTSIALDPDSPVPAVRQVADALRVELVESVFAILPSGCAAAIELGLHFNTVAEAYPPARRSGRCATAAVHASQASDLRSRR